MQTTNYEMTIPGSGYWIVIVGLFIFLALILPSNLFIIGIGKAKEEWKKKWSTGAIFIIILLVFLVQASWLVRKKAVTIDSKKMTFTEYILGMSYSAVDYDIPKISNFRIKHHVPTSWRNGRWVGTPFEFDPTVLYFDCDGFTESIGEHLTNFDAEAIIAEVQKRQNKK